eukprot:TRINITY_DN29073_c0_g1_i2.p1 TRINITY_DN29073_c0_g1~~TRINITY_DN29073_c0_g1_i2.p1  ORF type:complete len:331 (+),score=62.97 TRINITY_DN29073_c0_g1_i2:128-994(+)
MSKTRRRWTKTQLLDLFAASAAKAEPPLTNLRQTLFSLARDLRYKEAATACSLLLYSEALTGSDEGDSMTQKAVQARHRLLDHLGRKRWDERRVTGQELLQLLPDASPHCLCLCQRLVSLVSGRKHGPPSAELTSLATAITAAVRLQDKQGACAICLERWSANDRLLVPQCGHALHVDCFWSMITGPSSEGLRGHCRTCRERTRWGPLARANLRCTLSSAAAAAVARCAESGGDFSEEVAALCCRLGQEIGEPAMSMWKDLSRDLARRSVRGVRGVAALLASSATDDA